MEICGKGNIPGYLVTMDLEKAFDSLDPNFLIYILKKFGFGESFINWINIFLNDQQSCIINRGFAAQYFALKRGAIPGDPVSACLFIITLEVLFTLVKNKFDIKGIDPYDHSFLFIACADDSTFFPKDISSVKEM